MIKRIIFPITLFVVGFVISSCDKKVSVSGPQEYDVGLAKYYISTQPDGAVIFVDNRNTGLYTPDTVKWLPEGTHSFILKREPFLDYEFNDEVTNDKVTFKDYSFYSDSNNFGSLSFNSVPLNCNIFLNDTLMKFKTPYVLKNLLPDRYKVKYTYPEHRADSSFAFVRAGKQTFVSMELADTNIWITYDTENSDISDNTIKDILVTDDNIIWVGTWHNGLIKMKGNEKEFITSENSALPNDIINRIKNDKNGSIWVATYVGLAKIDGNIINSFTTNNSGLPSNYISDIEFDKSGNMWVGTQGGLAKYDGSSWKVYTTSNSTIPGNFVTSVLVDNNDTLWIGTNQFNTAKFDGIGTWTTYQSDELILGDAVADLIIGNDNKLWVGLVSQITKGKPGGVFILDNNQLVPIDFTLANKRINRFYMDRENTLWIGTRSGLLSVKSRTDYKLITSNITGLPTNDVLAIVKDYNGNVWLGTNGRGLVKYKIWKDQF